MTITIPNEIFQKYNEAVDALIECPYTSKQVTIYYPGIKEECGNCITSMIGDTSTNIYRHGGPAPFSFGSCPMCGGNGLREKETTDTIRLRVYFSRKEWIKIAPSVEVPDATALILGYNSDLGKIRKASEFVLSGDNNTPQFRFNLASEPLPHGFGNRYFIAFIKRV